VTFTTRLLLLLLLSSAAHAEFNLEIGRGNLSSSDSGAVSILLQERFGDKWVIGMGWIDDQTVQPQWERDRGLPPVEVGRNLFVHGQRLFRWKIVEIGVGPAYFQNTNRALGERFNVSASIMLYWTDEFYMGARHFSNAGSGTPNLGQDIFVLGYRFK
jgi:hypothetical protein